MEALTRLADHHYVLEKGRVVWDGTSAELAPAPTYSTAISGYDPRMSWIDPNFPRTATLTPLVGRVLGLNPGMMTGPGTNTYLIGRRDPILLDTGAGVDDYVPLFGRYLDERGWSQPSRVVLTHRHRDHLGGVPQLRERYRGLRVAKMIYRDDGLPENVENLADGARIEGDGATLVAIHTPGHASDHLCYYLEEEKAVFTGDVVLGGSTTVIPAEDGDLHDYLNSLKRLQGLDVQRIYPAHGPGDRQRAGPS